MSSCPAWCAGEHDGEPQHLTELQSVTAVHADSERIIPTLFADLQQGPGDDQPLVHLALDERPLVRLLPGEAAELGAKLILLAKLAGKR